MKRRRRWRFVLLILVGAFLCSVSAQAELSGQRGQVYDWVVPALVQIETGDSQGSGFYVAPEGIIVTNQHVVGSHEQLLVLDHEKGRVSGRVLATDPTRDLALVQASVDRAPILRLGDAAGLSGGEDVLVFGSPMGLSESMTVGTIMNPRTTMDQQDYVQINAYIEPGSSGGPVVDMKGNVVAVTTLIMETGGREVTLGIPVKDVERFLEEHDVSYSSVTVNAEAPGAEPETEQDDEPISGVNGREIAGMGRPLLAAALALLATAVIWRRRNRRVRRHKEAADSFDVVIHEKEGDKVE